MNRFVRATALPIVVATLAGGVSACSGSGDSGTVSPATDLGEVRVVPDEGPSGLGATDLLEKSPVAVVSAADDSAQAIAGSAAVALRAPLLVADGVDADALSDQLERLDVGRILRVGGADVPDGDWDVVDAPSDSDSLGRALGVEFGESRAVPATELDDELADSDPDHPTFVTLDGGTPVPGPDAAPEEPLRPMGAVDAGDGAPVVLASDLSSVASLVTARSSGANVVHVPAPDPRVDGRSVAAVKGTDSVVGLGAGFGDEASLGERVEAARTETELPGGGQLVFPGHRFVAAYGSPEAPQLGILGEQDPQASVERVRGLAEEYRPFSRQPVIPTFEIIGSIASASPGPDDKYSSVRPPAEIAAMVDAITSAGGYALIDLQPGRADFLSQATQYEDLLSRPGVGLALDPEWRLEPGARPAEEVGHVSVDEVNAVGAWLADLTARKGLPQKMFVVHQFQQQMIRDRERLDTSHPELATVIHVDGHGTPEDKQKTWDVMKENLPADVSLAWKNFIDEDTPTYTPEQTMAQVPQPALVTYQ